jgi:4-hydroxy-tetrahydrodipicolinate reductase
MNIALIGYGKMGKSIEKMATQRGHHISSIVDLDSQEKLSEIAPDNTDVVIEFSNPSSAFDNIGACLRQKVPVISGTTGWLDQLPNIEALCVAHQGTFLTASNFSLGVNIFFKLNEWLSQVIGQFPDYKIDIEETHHLQKLDKPSGTAITLAEDIIKTHPHYRRWALDASKENDIKIASFRQEEVAGKHVIKYHSSIDTIAITHEAHSREGFTLGAVLVAEWIQDKKGIFTMNDFIKI